MKIFLLTAIIGIVAGIIDILPMLKMKLDRYSVSSAFAFYFFMPFVILKDGNGTAPIHQRKLFGSVKPI